MRIAASPARRRLPAVVLALLLAVTVGTLQAAAQSQPATLAAPEPDAAAVGAYTVFNDPSGGADNAVEQHLVELVDGAPAGSTIHGAMFTWTRTPVAEALQRAQQRGVTVKLAIDREGSGGANADPDNPAIDTLKNAGLSQLVLCGNDSLDNSSCIGNRSNSINHNKDFLFSATGSMTDVVWVSSQNLTHSQNDNYNNTVVVHGDPELYGAFSRHMDNMLAQNRDNNYHESPDGYFNSPTSKVRAYFSPRADSNGGTDPEASTDMIVNRLKFITEGESGCSVSVAHALFTGSRAPVADELIRIARLGCTVRVVGGPTDYIKNRLAGVANVQVRDLDHMHQKYIIYSGNYNGTSDRTLVYTGSHNLTGPAQRAHDETMIRVERPEIASAFQDNFDLVWSRAG